MGFNSGFKGLKNSVTVWNPQILHSCSQEIADGVHVNCERDESSPYP